MNKRVLLYFVVIGALLVAVIFNYKLLIHNSWTHWNLPLSGRVIVLDAGHGGYDNGAVRENVQEKNITLCITQYLRDYLQQSGALVLMTRETDTDLADINQREAKTRKLVDLSRRANFVNNSSADLFISVHLNAFPSSKWRGAQTFFNPKSERNEKVGSFLQDSLRTQLGNTNRIALETNNIYLLNKSKIPSALVEVGFLSNSNERNLLQKQSYQKKIAGAIYNGILRYYTNEKTPPIIK